MGVIVKSISAFCFILLLGVSAHSFQCGQLFNQPVSYDSFMPEITPFETIITTSREVLKDSESKINNIINIMNFYYQIGMNIRKIDLDVFQIDFTSNRFSRENNQRFKEVVEAIDKLIVEILEEKKIRYSITPRSIVISPLGDHYLNKLAKRLRTQGGLTLSFNTKNLLSYTAGGIFFPDKIASEINLPPKFLRESSFFQEDIARHEFTHYKDFAEKGNGPYRPYHASIVIKTLNPKAIELLGVYRRGFSVDEIKAYRTTLRHYAHDALTAKNKSTFSESYKKLIKYLDMEIEFSRITKMVFEKYLSDGKGPKSNKVLFPEFAEYTIDRVAAKPENARQTLEMAEFTHTLFMAMKAELAKHEKSSFEKQRALVVRINSILSKPEIRKLHGNYPSIESIMEILRN